MDQPWVPEGYWDVFPHTLTVITTYKCNAQCRDCCFECNPTLSAKLSFEEIASFIDQAWQVFPGLRLVVFSGGEPLLLGEDLFASLDHVQQLGLLSRCVTNGYWGKTHSSATRVARRLSASGLNEINLSTGVDHAEWVPVASVVNAAKAVAENGIFCVITIEQDSGKSEVISQVKADEELKPFIEAGLVKLQVNSWMPFHADSTMRKVFSNREDMLLQGCGQVLENCVITPNKEISGCCGLTFEHIPEMKLGSFSKHALEVVYFSQVRDFLKIWIKVDGPYRILKILSASAGISSLEHIVHPCQACALLHQDERLRESIKSEYGNHMGRVLRAFYSQSLIQCDSHREVTANAS